MYFNFKHVPVKHQLLVANLCVLVWSVFLSFVCHDDSLLRSFDRFNPFHREEDIEFLAAAEEETKHALLAKGDPKQGDAA